RGVVAAARAEQSGEHGDGHESRRQFPCPTHRSGISPTARVHKPRAARVLRVRPVKVNAEWLFVAHVELAIPVLVGVAVDAEAPHVTAADVEWERAEAHRDRNVDERSGRETGRAAHLELPFDAE